MAIRPTPPMRSSPANRCAGCGSGRSAAGPTSRPPPKPSRGARQESSSRPSRRACATSPRSAGRRGLIVFAIDTELLGHWWSEGVVWLRELLAGAAAAGVRLLTAPQALAEHEPVARPLAASTWGEDKDLQHLGLAAGRRPRLGRSAARASRAASARPGPARTRCAAGRARAARRSGQRLGLPRQARPGGGLPLPPRDRSRRGVAGGLRVFPTTPAHAWRRRIGAGRRPRSAK